MPNQQSKIVEFSIFILLLLIIISVVWCCLNLFQNEDSFSLDTEFSTKKDSFQIPNSFKDGEEEIKLTWTDNNEGEDLIIQSDKKSYFGVNNSVIYFSITNTNKKDQEIDLRFLFQDKESNLESIEKINVVSESEKELQKDLDQILKKDPKESPQKDSKKEELKKSTQNLTFGSIENFKSSNQLQDEIKSGESNYYQATITYPANSKGEFYIESKGNNNAYGILDPWYDSTGLISYWTMDDDELEWGQASAEVRDRNGDANIGDAVNMDSGNSTTGKVGGALSFNGVDEYVGFSDISDFNSSAGSISFWAKADSDNGNINIPISISNSQSSTITEIAFLYDFGSGDDHFSIVCDINDVISWLYQTAVDYTDDYVGEWTHFVISHNGTEPTIYINGSVMPGSFTVSTDKTAWIDDLISASPTADVLTIGSNRRNVINNPFQGDIDEVLIYNKALTADQVTDLYNLGNRQIQNRALNNTGLVGYWTMDSEDLEWGQTSAEVRDHSGNGLHGNSANMTSGNEVTGKVDEALSFDGSTEYVGMGDSLDDVFAGADKKFSFSFWVKRVSNFGQDIMIIAKTGDSSCSEDQREFFIRFNTDNEIQFLWYLKLDNFSPSIEYRRINSTTAINDTEWHHVAVTYDGSIDTNDGLDRVEFYIDNVLSGKTLVDGPGLLGDIQNGTAHLGFGQKLNSSGGVCGTGFPFFSGMIDEFRIYNRVINSSEITNLYNDSAKKFKMSHVNDASLKSGLIGYWSMDTKDIDWTQTSAEITDRSDTEAHGNSINMDSSNAVTSKDGKLGQALSFNGSDEYIDLGDQEGLSFTSTNSQMTIGAWIYLDSNNPATNRMILSKYDSQSIELEYIFAVDAPNKELLFWVYEYGGVSWWKTSTVDNILNYDEWTHVAVTLDVGSDTVNYYVNGTYFAAQNDLLSGIANMSNTVEPVRIGSAICASGSLCSYWEGYLDEVRIYNRVLTSSEITALYNLTSQKVIIGNW